MTILFLVFLAALALLLQRSAQNRGTDSLTVRHRLSDVLVEPDQPFRLIISLENRSRHFFPFLRWSEHLPGEAEVQGESQVSDALREGKVVSGTTWLKPRQGLEKPVTLSLPRRGRYLFRELSVSRGDFLGLQEERFSCSDICEVVVMPREAADPQLDQVLGGFLGDVSVRRFLFEDPVLTLGFREYTGREPMKNISWTQSARAGQLMVKNFDYTAEPSLSIVLNVECSQEDGVQRIEQCFRLARTVCRKMEDQGVSYDFHTNAQTLGELASWRYVSQGLGPRHFYGILEGLGRADGTAACSCQELLEGIARTPGPRTGVIFITPVRDPAAGQWTARLADLFGGQLLTLTADPEVTPC